MGESSTQPLVLIILDGFGHRTATDGNAVSQADTPYWNHLLKTYPHTLLEASGEAVGLPAGVMGNSEVGHLTIGSGRILYQDLSRIHKSIEDESFFQNDVFKKAFATARQNESTVHLMGLLSDGGVHSHERHLFALLKMAKQEGNDQIAVHCFLDGRDTPPASSKRYVANLQKKLKGVGEVATLIGRYYVMDRDKRWERVQVAYEALVGAQFIEPIHKDPLEAIDEAYRNHVTDEFIKPIIFPPSHLTSNRIQDGDVVIFFNFRADRAREITIALTAPDFDGFPRKIFPKIGMYVTMTQYDKNFNLPVAFPPERPKHTLAELISEQGLKQFHTAETEKYAHVTYFLNGGVEAPFPGEERLLIPSPKEVATYDQKPEMNASLVAEAAIQKIREGIPIIMMNFANPDMVGHSGKLLETIRAVEVIDGCLKSICEEVLKRQGTVLITADHGNCEQMLDEKGGPHTAHTTNPVPFVLVNDSLKGSKLKPQGGLRDVTPTILKLLNIPQPKEMTGGSLIA